MAVYLSELRHLAIKAESTEGTDASVAAADAKIVARNVEYSPEMEHFEREVRRATFSPMQAVPGVYSGGISFEFDLWGSATAGTAADWGPALIGCGFTETISGGVSVTYTPAATGAASVTIADYVFPTSGNPYRRALIGARGNVEFSANAGGPLIARCSYQGAYQAPTNPSSLGSITYDADGATPPRFAGASFAITTVGGGLTSSEAILSSWSLNMNNVLTPRLSANNAAGIPSIAMTGRAPSGSFELELPSVTDCDIYAGLVAGTTGAMSFAIGSGTGKVITVTLGNVMLKAAGHVSAGGIERLRVDYSAYATAAGNSNEISIALT